MANFPYGTGWLPDRPDVRDYHVETGQIFKLLNVADVDWENPSQLPPNVDLRQWCSPIENQRTLGACSAIAGIGLAEYFQRRAFGKHLDVSPLFLYKVTRKLMGVSGDTGAFLRTVMKALVLFGVPPEEAWPYAIENFDAEPPAFCYAYGQNYQAVKYYRLDSRGTSSSELLNRIFASLAAELPVMFGFSVHSSITQATETGCIPFPTKKESVIGGHAVCAVGYDDEKIVENQFGVEKTKGALLIRNSWGTEWGEDGYGWLPYEYVRQALTGDWWSLVKSEWVDPDSFE